MQMPQKVLSIPLSETTHRRQFVTKQSKVQALACFTSQSEQCVEIGGYVASIALGYPNVGHGRRTTDFLRMANPVDQLLRTIRTTGDVGSTCNFFQIGRAAGWGRG